MKIAVGYVRCSTDEQGATSIPQQKEEIERWSASRQIKVIEWFTDEGRSGTEFERRAAFMELKKRVETKPNFSCVICYDESRWGRAIDPEENTFWQVFFRKRGVEVLLVHTYVDRTNEFAPVMSSLERVQSSQYSKKLSELTLRGCMANGRFSNGGTAPYGYKRIAINTGTGATRELKEFFDETDKVWKGERCIRRQEKVVWDIGEPNEIETVKRIFKLKCEGRGLVAIADNLNRTGIPCPKRGRWRAKDQKWSGVTIKTIVNNPAYYGARAYNRNSMSKIIAARKGEDQKPNARYGHWRNYERDWVVTENAHPPIISKETFEKANESNRAYVPTPFAYKGDYLLTGLLKCPLCGFNYQGQGHRDNGIVYYVDGGFKNKGASVCSHHSIRKEIIEKSVIDLVKNVISNMTLVEKVEQKLEKLLKNEPDSVKIRLRQVTEAHENNEKAIANLLKVLEQGSGLDSVFFRLRELEGVKRRLFDEKLKLEGLKPQQIDCKNVRSMVEEFIREFPSRFDQAPLEEKKFLLRKVIAGIVIDRKNNSAVCHVKELPGVDLPIYENMDILKHKPPKNANAPDSAGAFASFYRSGGRT